MRTFIQLSIALFISFTLVSCGNDSKSSNAETVKDNSSKPVPTFKMANDKSISQAKKPTITAPTNNNGTISNKAKNNGASLSNKVGAAPTKTTAKPVVTPGMILSKVPKACSLISVEEIGKIFGIPAADIKQKDASHTKSPYTSSCFFRWDGASPNTGILLQVQANPVEEEYAEWVSLFVSSKRTTGEKTMGNNETFKYDKMEGLGDDGSYSHRLGKYVWRDGNKYAFMIAFNTNSAKELQMKNAKTIGNIMMKNYKNL